MAEVDERTFVTVMTHNFLRDKEYLRSFLGSNAAPTSACSGRLRGPSGC